jgi:ribosome-binding protein aMBF1 (putative translation factor)
MASRMHATAPLIATVLKGRHMAPSDEHPRKVRVPAGFSGRLRKARLARGWSPTELAHALNLRPSAVHSWEAGHVFWITRSTLTALATALEVEPGWLLTRPLPPEPRSGHDDAP